MKELLLLSGLGILSLVAEILNARKLIYPLVILGLLMNIGLCIHDFGRSESIYGMMVLDNIALAFTILFSFIAVLWFLMAKNFFKDDTNLSDHFSLVLFAIVGVFILTSYTHMVMLFLGVEILSIPIYVLAGSDKRNIHSNEAAFKYFLLGAFASAFLLLGITFVYGALGSFNIVQIASGAMSTYGLSLPLLIVGILLILFAMAFKMSAVPFHFWAPDVYTGAPTIVTAFMSTIVKIGAVVGFYRLFSIVLTFYPQYVRLLLIIAVMSILIGNIIAASQSNIKRMLAYSGIGHVGFVVLGITMLSASTPYVTWYYLAAYTLAGLAAFWVLIIIADKDNNVDISAFNGLVKRNPLLAGTMTIALLSMAGIPPLAGFFAKYFILINVIDKGFMLIAIIAILASLIGVYYYFRIIIAMFTHTTQTDNVVKKIDIQFMSKLGLGIISLLLLLLGIMPDYIFSFIFR